MRAPHRVLAGLAVVASLGLAACGPPAPEAASSSPSSSPSDAPAASASPSSAAPSAPPAAGPSAGPTSWAPQPGAPPPSVSPQLQPQPVPGLPSGWRGIDLERIPGGRSVVALTFDGGSSDVGVPAILATLDEQDVPATFFVTGAFARAYPSSVRAIVDAEHAVGNHSDRHLAYTNLRDVEITADLAAAEASIVAATGRAAAPLFRFPFGARTDHDIRVVNDAGYLPIRWSVDSLGWKGTSGGLSVDEVVDRVVRTAAPGHIVLMHVGTNPDDGSRLDADALPRIIEQLRARGYGFVALGDLVG